MNVLSWECLADVQTERAGQESVAPVTMELGERLWPRMDPWSFNRDSDRPGKEKNRGRHGIRKTKGRWYVKKDGYMLQ